MGGKEKTLPYSRISINNCRKNDKNRKSPFDKHNHNYFRQEFQWMLKSVGKIIKRNRIFT